jgi:hypothetical protein
MSKGKKEEPDTFASVVLGGMNVVEEVLSSLFEEKPSLEVRQTRALEEIARNTRD